MKELKIVEYNCCQFCIKIINLIIFENIPSLVNARNTRRLGRISVKINLASKESELNVEVSYLYFGKINKTDLKYLISDY